MTIYSEGYFQYEIENNEITIVSYFGSEKEIIIPDHIGEMPVLKLGPKVFSNENIEVITIPETVDEVDDNCFINASNLKTIHSYSKADFKVPFGVELIYEEIQYANENVVQDNMDIIPIFDGDINKEEIIINQHGDTNISDELPLIDNQNPKDVDYFIDSGSDIETIEEEKQEITIQEEVKPIDTKIEVDSLSERIPYLVILPVIVITIVIILIVIKQKRKK